MHHPYVSSGQFATASSRFLWEASVTHGADLVMSGHDHHYERFAPLDATGAPAAVPGSQFMMNSEHGVVQLTLTPTSYSWGFISALNNATYDAGTAPCTP
jgi:hypothetical protein